MKLSEQLFQALFEDQEPLELEFADDADRVQLRIGQQVEVRTKEGEFLAIGYISELNQDTGFARVVDNGSGTDNHIDVDPDLYDMWLVGDDVEPEIKDDPKSRDSKSTMGQRGSYTTGKMK